MRKYALAKVISYVGSPTEGGEKKVNSPKNNTLKTLVGVKRCKF